MEKIIPHHKIKKWVLPEETRHRKKSGKKNWKIEAKYQGPVLKNVWFGMSHDRVVGGYANKKDAEKALRRIENLKTWEHFTFKVVHVRTKKS